MMKAIRAAMCFSIMILLLLFTGPRLFNRRRAIETFVWKNGSDPAADLEAAWEHDDRRFVAVNGYASSVPIGAPPDLVEKFGIKTISGTSDYLKSPFDAEFNSRARSYAGAYNALLAARIRATPAKR